MPCVKRNVLIFVEPHPLRNSFTEFLDVGRTMAGLLASMNAAQIDWRLFSNDFVLTELEKQLEYKDKLIAPSKSESEFIASCLTEWTDEEFDKRTSLVNGEGHVSEFYQNVLGRIRKQYNFDTILLWSENGAVRRFAASEHLSVLHMELGPTRSPFPETVYVDFRGTNGSASFLEFDLSNYPAESVLPAGTWIGLSAATMDDDRPSIMELQAVAPAVPFGLERPYVVVALQLADDLNTLCHSSFRTPREFLEFLLPKLITLGFKVIVKGHPGSPARPVNLVHEIAALEYARGFGEDVVIVDRTLPSKEFIPILASAMAVCSINSSVSFEAILMGVPGLVFGTAVYDLGLSLKKASEEFLETGKWSLGTPEIDRLVTVLCRHVFHPKNPEVLAETLRQIVMGVTADMTPAEYAALLTSVASHGYAIIDDEANKTRVRSRLGVAAEVFGSLDRTYMGHIDELSGKSTPHGYRVSVKGWAARRGNYTNVRIIAVCNSKGDVLSYTEPFDRGDVRKVHPDINYPVGFNVVALLPGAVDAKDARLLLVTDEGAVACVLAKGGLTSPPLFPISKASNDISSIEFAKSRSTLLMRSVISEINTMLGKPNARKKKRS